MADYYVFCEKKLYDAKRHKIIKVQQSKEFNKDVQIVINLDIVNLATMKDFRRKFIANKYYRYYDTSEVIQVQALDEKNDKN